MFKNQLQQLCTYCNLNNYFEHKRYIMRTFAYLRVSTDLQDNANQLHEIEKSGYQIQNYRVFADQVSGRIAASERPEFKKLLQKFEQGDRLVISKIDRLGRSSLDILSTLEMLKNMGVSVVCLQLNGTDLTSTSGQLLVTMLAAVAQMERDLISERTKSSLAKKKAEGVKLGRPNALSLDQKKELLRLSTLPNFTISNAAKHYGVSRASVMRAINTD